MKTLAITVNNKQQEKLLVDLAEQLGLPITEAAFKPLTHREVALGTAKGVAEDRLEEYLHRNADATPKSAADLKKSLKKRWKNKS